MTFRPLTHRALQWLADNLSLPPVATGIVCTTILGGLALWFSWFIGIVDEVAAGRQADIAVRALVTLYMMLGYLPMALYYLGRWTTEHVDEIARQFALDRKPVLFPRSLANWVGAVGTVATCLLFLQIPDNPLSLLPPWRWPAEFAFSLVGLVFLGWFNFRFMFLLVWMALTISRTAKQIRHIDLFDTSMVKPYAQQGVRSSLLAVVSLSISANLWLDPNSPAIATATTLVLLVAAAVLALLLPTWGIHLRLKASKQSELNQIRKAIALRRDPVTRSVDDAQQLRADLALERRLMEMSEWPFDAGSYGRVALYIMLGLGSWVGAALVERLLESLGR
ncbi:MAG: hypothetical protein ACR2PS_17305 [Pseudomonadales bacterium]